MMMSKMMIEMKSEEIKKLKREILEVCLNCMRLEGCENIGKFVECVEFVEVEDEAWVIRRI